MKGRKGGGQEVACRVGGTMRGKRQVPMLHGVNEERGRENAAGRMAVHTQGESRRWGGGERRGCYDGDWFKDLAYSSS